MDSSLYFYYNQFILICQYIDFSTLDFLIAVKGKCNFFFTLWVILDYNVI